MGSEGVASLCHHPLSVGLPGREGEGEGHTRDEDDNDVDDVDDDDDSVLPKAYIIL